MLKPSESAFVGHDGKRTGGMRNNGVDGHTSASILKKRSISSFVRFECNRRWPTHCCRLPFQIRRIYRKKNHFEKLGKEPMFEPPMEKNELEFVQREHELCLSALCVHIVEIRTPYLHYGWAGWRVISHAPAPSSFTPLICCEMPPTLYYLGYKDSEAVGMN